MHDTATTAVTVVAAFVASLLKKLIIFLPADLLLHQYPVNVVAAIPKHLGLMQALSTATSLACDSFKVVSAWQRSVRVAVAYFEISIYVGPALLVSATSSLHCHVREVAVQYTATRTRFNNISCVMCCYSHLEFL